MVGGTALIHVGLFCIQGLEHADVPDDPPVLSQWGERNQRRQKLHICQIFS